MNEQENKNTAENLSRTPLSDRSINEMNLKDGSNTSPVVLHKEANSSQRKSENSVDLAAFIKDISSPSEEVIPSNRRRTIDISVFKDILGIPNDSPISSAKKSVSTTPTRSLNNDDILEFLSKAASSSTNDSDDSIALENRVVVDVAKIDSLWEKLTSNSAPSSKTSSIKQKKRKSKSLESDASDQFEQPNNDVRRQTMDPEAFASFIATAFSPAGDDVPGERRLVVDEDAAEMIKEAVKSSSKAGKDLDTGEFLELIRVAISPSAVKDQESDEDEEEVDDIEDQPNRRRTLDPLAFAQMLEQLGSATKSERRDSVSSSQDEGDTAFTPVSNRRQTIDAVWLKGFLSNSPKSTKPPESSAKKSATKEKSPAPASVQSKRSRRKTIDANDIFKLLGEVCAQSPDPSSPYVSPPVSRRTRSATKSPASKSKTPESLKSNKKGSKSPSAKKPRATSSLTSPIDSLHDVSTSRPAPSIQPVSALRSCLSTRKSKKAASTPSKAISFGLPNAAEFKQSDPSSALTPMHRDRASAFFPMTGGSDESETTDEAARSKAESETLKNSRILSEIGHMDVLLDENGEKVVSPPSRRLSQRFTAPTLDEMDDIEDGSGLMPSNADLTGGYEHMGPSREEPSVVLKNLDQSFHSTMEDNDSEEEDSLLITTEKVHIDEDKTMELEGNLADLIESAENSEKMLNDKMLANDDKTLQLESDLVSLAGTPVFINRQLSARRSSGKKRAPFSAASSRLSTSGDPEDRTVELENGFMDLLALTESIVNAEHTPVANAFSFSTSPRSAGKVTPFKAPSCPCSSKSSAVSIRSNCENGADIGHAELTANAFDLLLTQQSGREESIQGTSPQVKATVSEKTSKKRLSLFKGRVEESDEGDATEDTPIHLLEYQKLLSGLGAIDLTQAPAEALKIAGSCDTNKDMSFVCEVEHEVLQTSIDTLKSSLSLEAGDMMVGRLWDQCKTHRLTTLQAHPTEKLLTIVLSHLGGKKIGDEDMKLMEDAKLVLGAIQRNASLEFQAYEIELARRMEAHYEEKAEFVTAEGQALIEARNEFELLEKNCDEEISTQNAAIEYLQAKEENEVVGAELAELQTEMAMLEAELAQAEESARDAAEHLSSLEAIKSNKLEVEALREESEVALSEADVALEDWNLSSGLRSWVPRELGGKGEIIVDFPLLPLSPYGFYGGDVSRLRLKLGCGIGGEYVQNIDWVIVSKPESSSKVLEELGHPSPFTKRHKRSKNALHMRDSAISNSVIDKLRNRLVNEWVGREAARLSIHQAVVRDVPKTLNRFDAIVGRMNLVLEEVRRIESLGLFVSFRDGDSNESHSAGLWLQVDMSSLKHHCKVRMEVRVVDGYPWAPAEVNLIDVIGHAPVGMKKAVDSLRTRTIPNGMPIALGAGAVFSTVKGAYDHMR